jgi:3-hydroxyisobutyrate dehydrogenase-like beta-hydroxyacid dehydrogenase
VLATDTATNALGFVGLGVMGGRMAARLLDKGTPDAFLASIGPGKLLIDMSTVTPAVSRAAAAKVRERGGQMLDAPVSGSVTTGMPCR